MAVGFAVTGGGGNYNGRITSFMVLSCIVASMGAFIFGYDIGVSGGVTSMEPFLRKFFPKVYRRMKEDTTISNYCLYDSQLLTLFTSSLYLAGLATSFFASLVTRAYGRKPSILAGGVAFLVGAVLNGAAVDIYMLIVGRILLGVGVGFTNQGRIFALLTLRMTIVLTRTSSWGLNVITNGSKCNNSEETRTGVCIIVINIMGSGLNRLFLGGVDAVPLYLSEMALSKYRGAISNGFQLSISIGFLTANLINYFTEKITGGWGWRVSLAMVAIPAFALTLGTFFLPETPNSLIQQCNKEEKARKILQRVRGTDDVQAELDDIITASDISRTLDNPYRNILKRRYRPHLVMGAAIPFFQIVTGINVIGFYAPLLFRTIGLGESVSLLSSLITGVVGSSATLVSMFLVDKLGRRFLLIFGGVVMFVSQMSIGGVMAAKLGDKDELRKEYAYAVLALISVYIASFSVSWGPLGWLIPSEIFPLEIRSVGQSITASVNFMFTFVVGQTFLSMLCHFKAGIFLFFGGWVALMTGFIYFLLPETKGTPIEQMERIWREHWFWKGYVGSSSKEVKDIEHE